MNSYAAISANLKTSTEADSTNAQPDLNSLNNSILKTLAEMQRLNTGFRIASTEQPKFRQWRQSAYVETNSGCTLAGTIDSMRLQYANIYPPEKGYALSEVAGKNGSVRSVVTTKLISPHAIRPALSESIQEPQVVGNCFNICGDFVELGFNANRYFQLKSIGLNSASYRRRILSLKTILDEQIRQRDALQSALSADSPDYEKVASEGQLQHDLRDLVLIEYSQYHSSAIRAHYFQNAAYLLDLAKNSTGAAAGIVSIEGNHLRDSRIGGGSALLTTVSGALILVIPFAGRIAGNWAGTVDRRIVSRDFKDVIVESTDKALKDQSTFRKLASPIEPDKNQLAPGRSGEATRLYGYSQLCALMKEHETHLPQLLKDAKRATIENVIYGTVVGTSKVSLGVCGIIAGWRAYTKPWIASRLFAAGNTAYACGTAFSLAENLRVLYSQQHTLHKRQEQGITSAQIYRARLNRLSQVEAIMNKND